MIEDDKLTCLVKLREENIRNFLEKSYKETKFIVEKNILKLYARSKDSKKMMLYAKPIKKLSTHSKLPWYWNLQHADDEGNPKN